MSGKRPELFEGAESEDCAGATCEILHNALAKREAAFVILAHHQFDLGRLYHGF